MKAKLEPRIYLKNRPVLKDVVPLETPFIINVDPSDVCNLRCNFCPTGDLSLMRNTAGRMHGPMKFSLFQKIIGDICGFPKPLKVLRLYKDGEPLVNPKFAEMVHYAKKSGCAEIIDTTTNATLLDHKRSTEIIEAGLDRLNISIYGVNSEQYRSFCHKQIAFETLVENLTFFYQNRGQCKMMLKINGDFLSDSERANFFEVFGDICDGISIEHVAECWPGFDFRSKSISANPDLGIYGQPIEEVLVCPYIFYSFSINSSGVASACFLDWNRKLIIGDATRENVVDIWEGSSLTSLQKMMLRGERKSHPVCVNCDQLRRGKPDNIDIYRETLLEKLEALR